MIEDVCLLIIRDGRDQIHDLALQSAAENLPKFRHSIIINDREHTLGFAGAIQEGWRQVIKTNALWVFHFEADFLFRSPISIKAMRSVLLSYPEIAQLSLKRQPWNQTEISAGGIVEASPDDFVECCEGDIKRVWTEHRQYFTTNPSLYPARWCHMGWPQERHSEGKFTQLLLKDRPKRRFAIWGRKFDPPLVTHIGTERTGVGY
jgi:hypothetical protein